MTARLEIVEGNLPDPWPMGWRHYAVFVGHKHATMLMLATGERLRVPLDVYRRSTRPLPEKLSRLDRVRKRLRRNAACFGTDKFEYLKDALRAIR